MVILKKDLNPEVRNRLIEFQRDEITGHILYKKIAKREKDEKNKAILEKIASDEKEHAEFWEDYTGVKAKPRRFKIFFFTILSYIMGYTFTIKLMEQTEEFDANEYKEIEKEIPEARDIIDDEHEHEEMLMEMLDEERLQYVGAMVLGLNDALVELTGTIAGLTFALMHTRLVALSGIITGISATLSMAASNYLAEKADGNPNALKSSIYTGAAYLVTVVLMVLPYLIFPNNMYLQAFILMIVTVVLIIAFFNYYISVARSQKFFKNFATMTVISLSVALISFVIGILAKRLLNIDI